MSHREIIEIRRSRPATDGDGVAIQRVSGMRHAGMDPVLMIDELRSEHREDFAGGFPPHPHRGMQTLTYMKRGGILHEDSQGNRGEIRDGGAQWMSAGRGVIHSEVPTQDSTGLHGFQLWVNLPAAEKMGDPLYRDVPVAELAHAQQGGVALTAISGAWQFDGAPDITGPLDVLARRAAILDLQLDAHGELAVHADVADNLLAYVYHGSVSAGECVVGTGELAVTGSGDRLTLAAGGEGASVLLLRGEPLREPVAHYGPFVMNMPEEIEQAVRDYQAGRFA